MAFSSQNLIESRREGAKEEEEEPRRLIGLLEETEFLGALRRKLNQERERREIERHSRRIRH